MNTSIQTAPQTGNTVARHTCTHTRTHTCTRTNSAAASRQGRTVSVHFGALTLSALMTFGTLLSIHTMAASDVPAANLARAAAVTPQA
jgi:hypothetical protein